MTEGKFKLTHWRDEFALHLKPSARPKTLILNDPQLDVPELLKYNYSIATYHYVVAQLYRLEQFEAIGQIKDHDNFMTGDLGKGYVRRMPGPVSVHQHNFTVAAIIISRRTGTMESRKQYNRV